MIVFDSLDADEVDRAQQAYGEVTDLTIALGGTIAGEHSGGRLKKRWFGDYLGDDMLALNHRVKAALDTQCILNPRSMLAVPSI